MNGETTPPVRAFFLISLILIIVGWGGLLFLVMNTFPTVFPRWLFFFLLVLAVTGAALPVVAFLNRRFPGTPPASGAIIIRQATWFGLFAATSAWLQMGRVLTPVMAFLLLSGFVLVEFLLRLNERSQWKP